MGSVYPKKVQKQQAETNRPKHCSAWPNYGSCLPEELHSFATLAALPAYLLQRSICYTTLGSQLNLRLQSLQCLYTASTSSAFRQSLKPSMQMYCLLDELGPSLPIMASCSYPQHLTVIVLESSCYYLYYYSLPSFFRGKLNIFIKYFYQQPYCSYKLDLSKDLLNGQT